MQIPVKRRWTGRYFLTTSQARADYDDQIGPSKIYVIYRHKRSFLGSFAGCMAVSLLAISCSPQSSGLCNNAVSVPSFTTRFLQGLNNFSEDQYENLRVDALRTRETVVSVFEQTPDNTDVGSVLQKIDRFILAMEVSDWDVSVALNDEEANLAAEILGGVETISEANTVDSLVIAQCGLPSTFVPNDATVETLPMPWIPSPTDTEPDSELVDDESERYALGLVVGTLFQLTLSNEDVLCLGTELVGVVDQGEATSNAIQYQRQFQTAFDNCSIDIVVPTE